MKQMNTRRHLIPPLIVAALCLVLAAMPLAAAPVDLTAPLGNEVMTAAPLDTGQVVLVSTSYLAQKNSNQAASFGQVFLDTGTAATAMTVAQAGLERNGTAAELDTGQTGFEHYNFLKVNSAVDLRRELTATRSSTITT